MLTSILLFIIIVLAAALVFTGRKTQGLEKELMQIKNFEEFHKGNEEKNMEISNKLWNTFNAIHLYASLSEEETNSESVKDKQNKIMHICETILNKSL